MFVSRGARSLTCVFAPSNQETKAKHKEMPSLFFPDNGGEGAALCLWGDLFSVSGGLFYFVVRDAHYFTVSCLSLCWPFVRSKGMLKKMGDEAGRRVAVLWWRIFYILRYFSACVFIIGDS